MKYSVAALNALTEKILGSKFFAQLGFSTFVNIYPSPRFWRIHSDTGEAYGDLRWWSNEWRLECSDGLVPGLEELPLWTRVSFSHFKLGPSWRQE